MIPTTVTNSPSSTNGSTSHSFQNNSSSVIIGIASLILEGRAIADDEYHMQAPRPHTDVDVSLYCFSGGGSGNSFNIRGCSGQQSPKPCTSSAATSAASGSIINITTNPHHAFGYVNMPLFIDSYNSSSASSSADSTHQRWTQKLCQLRQASPAASLSSAVEGQSVAIEPELVSVTINESTAERGDFEIMRRVMLNRAIVPSAVAGGGSVSPGSGSEKFLHSLQSLATTCLRGNSPSTDADYRYSALSTSPLAPPVLVAASPKYSYRATPPRFHNPYHIDVPGSASSSGSGIQSPRSTWCPAANVNAAATSSNVKESFLRQASGRIPIPATVTSASIAAAAMNSSTSTVSMKVVPMSSSTYPQQGPHCDQFLRKMGLAKGEAAEAEDHFCDMSYVNITCSRWRAYCLKMEAIITRGESVCIEVYLGPVGHKILLEQWIITQKDRVQPPTMTLPSICSAIRSQLYFSQISAWCDLIKKSDKTIYDTGRIIFPTPTGAAGDLATPTAASSPNASITPGSSPSSTSSPLNQLTNAMLNRRPRLNIFYRIKHDSSACFNSKPNVHNFPNVNISENCSISVCLKSLPRINGGIPKIGSIMPVSSEGFINNTNAGNNASTVSASPGMESSNAVAAKNASQTPGTSRAAAPSNCDNAEACAFVDRSAAAATSNAALHSAAAANGNQKCKFFIDEDELGLDEADGGDEEDNSNDIANDSSNSFTGNSNLSHREKQLMKYRKRMLKRDKKHRKPIATASEMSFGLAAVEAQRQRQEQATNNAHCQPMEQGDDESLHTSKALRLRSTVRIQMISTGTQTQMTCCQQCGSEKTLLCLKCNVDGFGDDTSASLDDMDSSSSISSSDIIHTPRNQAELLLQAIQRTPKAAKHKKQAMRSISNGAGAVPKLQNNNHLNVTASVNGSGCQECKRQKIQHNFNTGAEEMVEDTECVPDEENESDGKGAKVDKVTLDVPVEGPAQVMEECFYSSTKLTPYIARCTLAACPTRCKMGQNGHQQESAGGEENCVRSATPPAKGDSAQSVDNEASASVHYTHYKTPTSSQQKQQQQQHLQQAFQQKQTPKPNLLEISCHYQNGANEDKPSTAVRSFETTPPHHNTLLLRKGLPKVNLTPIFCNPSATNYLSSPIPISCPSPEAAFSFDPGVLNGSAQPHFNAVTTAVDNNNIPVQKSYSAPTLPNSPSLSPRFAKQAAIYKRRSRHLSDRSDRSSLGSDEQFSDEDLENGMFSPATSPMKNRVRLSAVFARMPLLGNLEESLLQKRFMPKIEAVGFKVLLGASGGFCPTQLTIPAAAYFYELQGEALSTPYVCEIRLPRKGYSVPRAGTVQATLLNPMGTVVRMFVVPYDLRDMPPLHQTFIRQRVLAEASSTSTTLLESGDNQNNNYSCNITSVENGEFLLNGYGGGDAKQPATPTPSTRKYQLSPNGGLHGDSNLGHFISIEHMKRLRYSIHLRFQTSRSGRLSLHTDIRLLISRRTDCDTAAAHAKGVLEAPNDLVTETVMPTNPKYSARQENSNKI